MKLSTKLIGGFGIVAVITLLVGVVGWVGISKLTGSIDILKRKTIPSIHAIDDIESNLKSLRIAARTLMIPRLSEEDRAKQFTQIDEAKKNLSEAIKALEAVPNKSSAALDLEKQLKAKLGDYLSGVDRFIQMAKEIEATGITNPVGMAERIEHFQFLHYKNMLKVADLLSMKEEFEGGDDASKCEFGKWLATFKTDSEKLSKLIAEITPVHEEFHKAVKKIKDAVKAGDLAAANMIYRMQLKPAAQVSLRNLTKLENL
jgi:hypothetical protein